MVQLFEGWTASFRLKFNKNALSHASNRDSVSTARVGPTLCLILDEFHDRYAVF